MSLRPNLFNDASFLFLYRLSAPTQTINPFAFEDYSFSSWIELSPVSISFAGAKFTNKYKFPCKRAVLATKSLEQTVLPNAFDLQNIFEEKLSLPVPVAIISPFSVKNKLITTKCNPVTRFSSSIPVTLVNQLARDKISSVSVAISC